MSETAIQDNILSLWSVLEEFRLEGKFWDVRLQVGPELFHAHRFLLAAASEYFNAMFDGHFREKNVEESEPISLHDIDAVAFKEILEFIYTGNATVTDANVCNLLQASDFLQLRNSFVKNRCVEFIIKCVRTTNQPIKNAYEAFSLAVVMKNETLINALSEHMCSHLAHFSTDVKFSTISFDELNLILNGKLVAPCSEDGVLKAILRWINYSREERSKYRSQLMEKIDIKKISPDCIAFVLVEYEKRLDRVKLNEYSEYGDDEESNDTFLAACPVSVGTGNESLHIYFRSFKKGLIRVEKVNTSDGDSFKKDPVNTDNVNYRRDIALNGREYRMTIDSNFRKSFYAHDVGGPRILPSPPIKSKYFEWCGLHNNIYLCEKILTGEICRVGQLSRVHVYNCDNNHWLTLPPLLERTYENCITIHDNVIYVIGILPLEGHFKLICTQAYDLQTKEWRLLPRPKFERSDIVTCCTYKKKVYVLLNNPNQSQFYIFDPALDKWQFNVRLPETQDFWQQIVPYRNELWLISKRLDIAVYDDSLAKWRSLKSLKNVAGDEHVELVDAVVI